MSEGEDRTQDPSTKRLEQARRDGNVAISREVGVIAVLGAASGTALLSLPNGLESLGRVMSGLLANLGSIDFATGGPGPVLKSLVWKAVVPFVPVMAVCVASAIVVGLLQSGSLLRLKALAPDLSRVNPLSGAKKVFGGTTLIEASKSLFKLGLFASVICSCVSAAMPLIASMESLGPAGMLTVFGRLLRRAVIEILGIQLLIAVLDVGWVRYRHWNKLRMTRQEQREEFKESEGDPNVKGRLRALRNRRARRRMMDAVPTAAVIVTNPTHYAVALAYEPGGNGAPKVVAKGVDEVAARIREAARRHNIPLVPNPPLARALHRLEIDAEIPREHFQAVAAIIAFVWKQKRPNGLPQENNY